MYENKNVFEIIMLIICFVLILLFTYSFTGCATKVISDDGTRIDDYRELQNDIRNGETELAITSTRISNDSERIAETSGKLEHQLGKLEQTIKQSETSEQEIGMVLQRIRKREITGKKLNELGIEFTEIEISEN